MASRGLALPLLRRELRASLRAGRRCPSSNSAVTSARQLSFFSETRPSSSFRSARLSGVQTRPFSQSLHRRQADEAAFDPSQVEREFDEVDVCIVGGGVFRIFPRVGNQEALTV